MTYRYFKNTESYTAVNSAGGFIQVRSLMRTHFITTGINLRLCDETIRCHREIEKEEFFDYIAYPFSVTVCAMELFKKGDPDFEANSEESKKRSEVYNEQKSKPYH